MTSEHADIQQAAREALAKYFAEVWDVGMPDEVSEEIVVYLMADFHISRSEEERKRIQELERKLTTARLGIEWRDDVLGSWCDSVNDKRLADRRDKIQWEAFDKTNEFWEKDPSAFGLELSPYKEEFLIQTDSYRELEEGIHRELDKLGVPKSGGSIIRIRDLHKRSEAEVSRLRGALEHIRDKAANPMKSYDAGLVIDANSVLDESDEALAQPTGKEGES